MQTLKSPLFIICSTLFVLHQLLQHLLKIKIPVADNYLDNLLAMPVILTLLLAERRYIFRKGNTYQLPMPDILLATIYVSMISEWLFPWLSRRFTFDLADFLFFFLGTVIFYFVHNKHASKQVAV